MASPGRPVVVFMDDLQWAGRPALGFVDLLLGEEPAAGLLLMAAYRDGGVDAAQPLAAPLARWREMPGVRQLRLGNLPVAELGAMVAEMLQGTPATAGLAGVIEPYTAGNPYETVELLNALRRDGVLTAAGGRWRWEAAAVRAHLGHAEVAGLVAAQVEALPAPSRQLVEAMACLGGRAELSVLQAAAGTPATVMEQALAPALAEGVLLGGPGAGEAVRFAMTGSARRSWPGSTRRGGRHCGWAWRGGWPPCRSCSRSRPGSTCRWPTRSRTRRSGVRWRGCCGAPPPRRR
jgi:predicted ATPase